MTTHENKEYLKKYIPAISQLKLMQSRRDGLCSVSGQKITGMPTSHSSSDNLAIKICDLVCMEAKFFEKELQKYQDIISNVLTAIYGVKNLIEQQVLVLKYIHGMTWPDVAENMGYAETQIHRYHSKALQHIEINVNIQD